MPLSFRERYCAHYGLRPEQFETHLFGRALYPHARPVRWLLDRSPNYFMADREFLRNVGDLRSRRSFHAEAGEYGSHAKNTGFLRRWLRLRVSAERVRLIMESIWTTRESTPPQPIPDVSSH